MKKASTLRLHEDVQAGLDLISQLQHRPKNKLVNEAVAEYVTRHALQTEDELQAILTRVKAYQKSDPDFASGIAAFAGAEAAPGKAEDPMEGRPTTTVGPVTRNCVNSSMPDWDADSPRLRRNLIKILTAIRDQARARHIPALADA